MTPSGTLLLEKVTDRAHLPNPFTESAPCSMEQALLRARIAFDAGWQLTPDEILLYAGREEPTPHHSFLEAMTVDTEDEIDSIPDYFAER